MTLIVEEKAVHCLEELYPTPEHTFSASMEGLAERFPGAVLVATITSIAIGSDLFRYPFLNVEFYIIMHAHIEAQKVQHSMAGTGIVPWFPALAMC